MARKYIIFIEKEPHSAYGVIFPDFPGCVSATDLESDITAMAREAIDLHL